MPTPSYRYLLCDLLTDQLLAEVPLTGVRFDRRLCRVGSLTGNLEAPTPGLVRTAKLLRDYAGRSALWVYRDGQLWWGGIPWTVQARQGQRGGVQVQVQAATFDSYAHRRRLYYDLRWDQVDQATMIDWLWALIQAEDNGHIGVLTGNPETGILRDREYKVSDFNTVGQLIENLGDVIDGPEHTIDVYLDGEGNRIKRLRVANRLGITQPRVVFQRAAALGGRVLEWEDTADATQGGTVFAARGDAQQANIGEEQEPLLSDTYEATDLLAKGWPRLDMTVDHPGVIEKATLDGYAQALRDQYAGAPKVTGYTVQVANTGWNPNRLGDAVRVKLRDLWHDTVTDRVIRPVGCEVTPPEGGQAETVKLILSEDD